jgi:hypothetical protein
MYSPSAAISRGGTPSSGTRQQRPSSLFADERRQIALAEMSSRGQVRREVEHAAARVYHQEVREQRDAILEQKRMRVQDLEDAHKHDVDARNRHALAARVDRSNLDVDEVLQDKRLHAAMEAKLGRLTYMREQARVQRVIGTTRALLRRKEQEQHQKETLMALMANVHAKDARQELNNTQAPQISVGSTSPTRKQQQDTSRPGSSAEGQQREADISTRKRMVDKLLMREEQQRGFQPRPSAGSRGTVSQAIPHDDSASSRSQTPTPQLPRHQQQQQPPYPQALDAYGRPLSRANAPTDDVDWGGPLGSNGSPSNAPRPMSRQSQDRLYPHSRLSSANSSQPPLTRAGSSSTSIAMHRSGVSSAASSSASRRGSASRYMLPHDNRHRVDLPPLPALSTPSPSPNHQQHYHNHPPPRPTNARTGSAATNASYSSSTILDPFPEENAKAFHVMERHFGSQRNLLNFQRRPNSRGAEEQQAFAKHSMRVLGDMILGHSGGRSPPGSRQGPRRARSTSPSHYDQSHEQRRAHLLQYSRPSSSLSEPPVSNHQHHQSGLVVVDAQQRQPSPINGGRREFRTVQTTSRMLHHSIAGGICPPMSNYQGQLDHFEQHVANQSMHDAEEWVRVFGRHRAPFVPQPMYTTQDDEEVDEEGDVEEPPAQQFVPPQSYEMVDMQLPDEFHERRVGGGEWVTVLPATTSAAQRHQNDGFDDEEGLIGRDDDSTSSHITSSSRDAEHAEAAGGYDRDAEEFEEDHGSPSAVVFASEHQEGERVTLIVESPAPASHVNAEPQLTTIRSGGSVTADSNQHHQVITSPTTTPSSAGDHLATPPQQPFEELRAQLQAHHGGIGGDSPSRRRTYRGDSDEPANATTNSRHVSDSASLHLLRASNEGNTGGGVDGEESGEYDEMRRQDDDPDHHAYQMPPSVLPRHEPDFSFDNFLAGNFEVQPEHPPGAPPSSHHAYHDGRPVSRGDGAAAGGDRPANRAGPSRMVEPDEDEAFPAPPADSSRFVDFGSSSSDDDEDGGYGEEFDNDEAEDDGGSREVPPQTAGGDAVTIPSVSVTAVAAKPSQLLESIDADDKAPQRTDSAETHVTMETLAAPTNIDTEVEPRNQLLVCHDDDAPAERLHHASEVATSAEPTDALDVPVATVAGHAVAVDSPCSAMAESPAVCGEGFTPRTIDAAVDAVASELVAHLMAEWA